MTAAWREKRMLPNPCLPSVQTGYTWSKAQPFHWVRTYQTSDQVFQMRGRLTPVLQVWSLQLNSNLSAFIPSRTIKKDFCLLFYHCPGLGTSTTHPTESSYLCDLVQKAKRKYTYWVSGQTFCILGVNEGTRLECGSGFRWEKLLRSLPRWRSHKGWHQWTSSRIRPRKRWSQDLDWPVQTTLHRKKYNQ